MNKPITASLLPKRIRQIYSEVYFLPISFKFFCIFPNIFNCLIVISEKSATIVFLIFNYIDIFGIFIIYKCSKYFFFKIYSLKNLLPSIFIFGPSS